jgi:NADH:ubiquinone oxidoreductase subunit 3 (subunit A)
MMHSVELVLFIFVSALLAALFISLPFLIASQKADPEKLSAYECGFDPFDDARARFDIRFFLVALLFLVFDLEVSFLFPWSVCLSSVSQSGFWSIIAFLLVLTVGFVYEWQKGALEWE